MNDSDSRTADAARSLMLIAPLFPPALGFTVGVLLDARAAPVWYAPFAILLAATAAVLFRRLRCRFGPVLLFACGIAAGAMAHHGAVRAGANDTIERFAAEGGLIVRVRGAVASPVLVKRVDPGPLSIRAFRTARTVFLLDVTSVAGQEADIAVGGTIRVTIREAVLDLVEHERVELVGRLHTLHSPSNPGAFDWEAHMRRQGVVATMVCPHRENVTRVTMDASSRWARAVGRVRSTIRGWLVDDLVVGGDEQAGLLAAMVLGHRSALDRKINDAFVRAGCAHFLAVSGVHVVIVIFVASLLCRMLFLARVPRLVVLMVVVAGYAVLAEPRPSILRASVIAEIYFVGCLLYRERARLNWISVTVLVLGVAAPTMVFDVGYQLSTTAVIGICFLPAAIGHAYGASSRWVGRWATQMWERQRPQTRTAIPGGSRPRKRARAAVSWLVRYAGSGLSVSVGAWLATWPVVAVHFGQVHPYGPVATLVMMPMLTVLMALGFAKLVLSAVIAPAAQPLAVILDGLDSFVVHVADRLGALPGATVAGVPPPWWVIGIYYATLTAWCWYTWGKAHPVVAAAGDVREEPTDAPEEGAAAEPACASPWAGRVLVTALVLLAVSTCVWRVRPGSTGRLVMTVLDVGAGAAIVLELPHGETVLYDAGTLGPVDVGRHIIVPFLRHRGIRRLDRVYLSHANIDHFNGLPSVVEGVPCASILVNERFDDQRRPGTSVDRLHSLIEKAGARIDVMDPSDRRWDFGGAAFEMLWPPTDRAFELTSNDASTVLRVSYRGHTVLLAGDIEHVPQSVLLEGTDVGAEVLVLPHHGSVRPSSAAFFEAVGADVLIRSSNEPTAETYNGLSAITEPAPVWNTADVGAVTVVVDASGVDVSGLRPRRARCR